MVFSLMIICILIKNLPIKIDLYIKITLNICDYIENKKVII